MDCKYFSIEEKNFIINAIMKSDDKTTEEKLEIIKKITSRLNNIRRK